MHYGECYHINMVYDRAFAQDSEDLSLYSVQLRLLHPYQYMPLSKLFVYNMMCCLNKSRSYSRLMCWSVDMDFRIQSQGKAVYLHYVFGPEINRFLA